MIVKTIELELIGTVNVYLGLGIEIITSLILGGIIGMDREQKMKSAGLKTNILICLGSTLYAATSLLTMGSGPTADPNRTAAQIVSGIGFLGAGAIIQGRGTVLGLTTAATIWVVAAIGICIGFGYPLIATLFTLTLLIVLKMIGPFYRLVERQRDFLTYRVEILSVVGVEDSFQDIIRKYTDQKVKYQIRKLDSDNNQIITSFNLNIHPRQMGEIRREIKNILQVDKVTYRSMRKMKPKNRKPKV